MKNPVRRNRNIGTSKQGHGQNNELVIPWVASTMKSFHERMSKYNKEYRTVNGNLFEFIVEETRTDSKHSCTIEDIAEILRHINPKDYGRLNLIVLRQQKKKCSLPRESDSLKLDRNLNFKLFDHEKNKIYRDTDCRHTQGV